MIGMRAMTSRNYWKAAPAFAALFSLTVFAVSAKINPGYSGTVIGITVASGALGTLVAAPVMGLCFNLFPLAYGFSIASSSMLAGCLLIVFLKEG